ncbi:MAG: Bifunctional phosphoglucose/phosphomannose isomerase [Candidatus Levybacteria bacterium GW2011_GWA1_37_16]|nr:MAG: Bifunctional phosphoglucose/phosphomannose isomerase [Candidatus Levybacteria bacterium GW2011_GWA1_37_16]
MSLDVKKLDKSNFRQFILDSPSQFEIGMSLAQNIKIPGDFRNIVVSGMGGSALPANLLKIYCNDLVKKNSEYKPFEIYINRYYSLPQQSHYPNTLNIISSYSGNTEETISSLEEADKASLPFVGMSSGGKVEGLCKRYGVPHMKLPIPYPNFQPRMGTGYFFGAIVQLFINQGLIPNTSTEIFSSAKELSVQMENLEQKGIKLATKLKGKTLLIYASPTYKSVAMVWKIKMNENAKIPAFWNFFPEANHNEMVGFTNPQAKFLIIMLKDPQDHERNLKRYEATRQLLKEKGVESEVIAMEGDNVFSKIFTSIILADWTSYYLALEYGQDPTPVDMVENLKKILAS